MLQTIPTDEISWETVDLFCNEKIPEGAYIDYKEDFPSALEKTISAMANTIGGLIILGVEEEDNNRPKLPMKGIEMQRGLSERITNIILSNITPPVFPEIKVCPNADESKVVIVVRIHESNMSPHAIAGNTRIYLRTGDLNHPESRATVEDIQWMLNGRERSLALKNEIVDTAHMHFDTFYAREIDKLLSEEVSAKETTRGFLTISASPTYPKSQFMSPPEIRRIREKLAISDYYGTLTSFPPFPEGSRSGLPHLVKDGAVISNSTPDGTRHFFVELSSFGLYFYKQPVVREVVRYIDLDRDVLKASEIIARVDQFLVSASKFFNQIGHQGLIDISASLDNIEEMGLSFDWFDSPIRLETTLGFCPDDEVTWYDTIQAASLKNDNMDLLHQCMERLSWAFGLEFPDEYLPGFFKKFNRPDDL